MEKKTIGKLIAALRKANGMTQKELGEKLFVSDKTISRWECDECLPELSLIPAIAEIFGITADELIRGECNNAERDGFGSETSSEKSKNKLKSKSEKQFKWMLLQKERKYNNLTLISVGISLFAFLCAAVVNLGLCEGLIAFCVATACLLVSEICQICFANNMRIFLAEEDECYQDRIESINNKICKRVVAVSFINLGIFAFCLPLATINDAGITFVTWIVAGLICTFVSLVIGYFIYVFLVKKILHKRGLIVVDEEEQRAATRKTGLLKRIAIVSGGIALFLAIIILIVNILDFQIWLQELIFYDPMDFKAYVENEYDVWIAEEWRDGYVDINGDVNVTIPITPSDRDDPNKEYGEVLNQKGEIICSYYYCPYLYYDIDFETEGDQIVVRVITIEAYYQAILIKQGIESVLYVAAGIDLVTAIIIYFILAYKPKKRA